MNTKFSPQIGKKPGLKTWCGAASTVKFGNSWICYDDLSDNLVIDMNMRLQYSSNGLPPIDPLTVHLVVCIEEASSVSIYNLHKPVSVSSSIPFSCPKHVPGTAHTRSADSLVVSDSSSTCSSVLGSLVHKNSIMSAPPDVKLTSSVSSLGFTRASSFAPYSLPEKQTKLMKAPSRNSASGRIGRYRRGIVKKVPLGQDVENLVLAKMKKVEIGGLCPDN